MTPSFLHTDAIHAFIDQALAEDIGEGDHSTQGAVPEGLSSRARLLVKDEGLLAGVAMAQKIFQRFDPRLSVEIFIADGQPVKNGDVAFIVSGPARSILSTERLVLNCMQRMSGIATYTHRLTQLLEGTGAQVMDTRKTTPNFRLMEKWAVAIGGGRNHRFALYDMVMLKDNHHDMAGGITAAVQRTRAYLSHLRKPLKIEVETRNLREVKEALALKVDVIMLDNMGLDEMKEAVALIGGACQTEASGGITEQTLRAVAACGVDYISVGALTHSVKSLDLSLKVIR
ncbi:MAG: carboxylating nicotinate-nucleotide diphosphorylase [Cyclobacteriaceae bacterium]|jgi:nicotinate-nucleotide pyrophosphorylase (carboxylating)|nr:carboxylating nicotinate-nucleotide diphosphorylase [Cyclobacteriaceae bacterium]